MGPAVVFEGFRRFLRLEDYMLFCSSVKEQSVEMLLMGICISVFGMAIACAAFGAAVRPEGGIPKVQPEQVKAAPAPAQFFVNEISVPIMMQPRVPLEALLLQIESHVRLEQAAAESFLSAPTSALLHGRTISPFVN
jgi:hypothetical protein